MTEPANKDLARPATGAGIDPELFRRVMRNVPSAVAIVTYGEGARRFGLTATAICSVSAEPAQLLVCVNRQTSSHDALAESGQFAVNFLGHTQSTIAHRFSGAVPPAERFEQGDWTTLASGCPVLGDAIAAFDCVTVRRIDADTHTIFLGRVVHACAAEGEPLLYRDGAYSRLAPHVSERRSSR